LAPVAIFPSPPRKRGAQERLTAALTALGSRFRGNDELGAGAYC